MEMKRISIVIPTYNEEENVIPLHGELVKMFSESLPKYDYEILFIDNKSKDNTRDKIRYLCGKDKNTRAIFNARNFGHTNSPYYGILSSSGDCSILLCADFQDPIDLIPKMVKEWEGGFGVVCGVKTKSEESKLMYLLRSTYYKLIKSTSRVEQIEHFTGFGLYDKSFVKVLRDLEDPVPFLRGLVAELGPDRKIIEYKQEKRRGGKSKHNLYTLYDYAMLAFTSYTKVGLRILSIGGFFMAAISLLVAVVYLVLKLTNWDDFPGGTAPILIGVFTFGSIQLFFMGLLGEYIMSINSRIMNRPLVVEEERIGYEEVTDKELRDDEE
jgi:glycosyltransferase involved in cell wall biosynthesis